MYFLDLEARDWNAPEAKIGLKELKADWERGRIEDPENFYDPFFGWYLLEVIMATINGRNDLELVGMTPDEVYRMVMRLRKKVEAWTPEDQEK